MLTDAQPRKTNRAGFLESDRIKTLDLPQDGRLITITKSIDSAMTSDASADVRRACAQFLAVVSEFCEVPPCGVRVLAARPLRVREHRTTELFGDYSPDTMLIRVWMRTAVRKDITSFGTFLKHALPRILPPSGFSEVRIPGLLAHTRLLRESRCALPSRERHAAEEALLGAHDGRAVAHRLATHESRCVNGFWLVRSSLPE